MANKLFYLNGEQVNVEISPILAQTLDETIDNITIDLELNERKEPYPPIKTKVDVVQVYDDNSTETINKFVVSSDNVQLATQNPLRYKHTLSLVQRAQVFTKKESRNTVFSTSLESSYFSLEIGSSAAAQTEYYSFNAHARFVSYVFSHLPGKINLKKKKINTMKAFISFFIQQPIRFYQTDEQTSTGLRHYDNIKCEYIEPTKWSDAFVNNNNAEFKSHIPTITFSITLNNVTEQRQWNISDNEFVNNNEYKVPQSILDWIATYNDGELSIEFGNSSINTDWISNYMPNAKMPVSVVINAKFITIALENTCYEVIQTLLNQQLKETADYNRTNDPDHYVPLFELPTPSHNPELYELLTTTNAPNFVFTQGNMYEMLVEIFKLFDAIFTIDNDGYLDIEYYNEHKKITFEDNQKAGRASSLGEERFANRLISYYQNTKINDQFPNSNQENATAFLRSKSVGIPNEDDFVFTVPKPIDFIKKIEIAINLSTKPALLSDYTDSIGVRWITRAYLGNLPTGLLDITNYVFEKSLWSILSETKLIPIDGDWSKAGKYNTLFYEKGTPYIYVSAYYHDHTDIRQNILNNVIQCALSSKFGVSVQDYSNFSNMYKYNTVDWRNVRMSVSYVSLNDGKIVNESIDYKYDGGITINQNNGSIDINKLGLNMVGLSLKLGQPTLTMTQKICKWEDRVKKGEFFIDENGDHWVANTCNYTLVNKDFIEANIEFVKNFNGLASRIELNREKRLSNISNELTTKCEENYGEYIYYNSRRTLNASTEKISLNYVSVYNQIAMGFGLTVPSTILGDYEDMSSKVNGVSIATLNNTTTYTNQTLEKVTGFVESQDTDDYLVLNETSAFNGERVTIPLCSYDFDAIYWDLLNNGFAYDKNAEQAHPFQGTRITVWVLKIENEIIGGIIRDDFNNDYFYNVIPQNQNTIEYASLTAYDENDNVIQEDEYSVDNIAIPMVTYGSGNSVCFEMSFKSPIAAGTQLLDNYDSVFGTSNNAFPWFLSSGWFSKYVLYTAKDGTATKFTIDFVMLQENLTRQFPKLIANDETPLPTFSFGKIDRLAYYKKPNEIFALNYQLHFLPGEGLNDCFLTNEFIKNNGFANGLNKKEFHIMYSKDENFAFSIFDVKATEDDGLTRLDPSSASAVIEQPTFRPYLDISFSGYGVITLEEFNQIKAWALCDEDNNIYFSSNVPPKDNELGISFHIYFYCRHHRKEE